jgi:hypothetical protein
MMASALVCVSLFAQQSYAQQQRQLTPWERIAQRPATLGLEKGIKDFQVAPFKLRLVNASQTAAGLIPLNDPRFDYTPDERLETRSRDSLYHLGDLTLRLKKAGDSEWKAYATHQARKEVIALPASGNVLASADLGPTLPSDIPLEVKRTWANENGQLVLRFDLKNKSNAEVEIGSLGIPMIFNNILEGKHLDTAHADNVFFDPYIGQDAGYLQVNRLHGRGESLLVLPHENAPFENYNPLNDDPSPRGIVFEGFHEWMIHSKAHAETEWKGVEQWNTPTSSVLKAGESKSFAIKFVMAPSIREIEKELVAQKRPVAVGLPGYVLPMNEEAKLFLQYGKKVKSIDVYPQGALTIKKAKTSNKKWAAYTVDGKQWGRARVTVKYADGTTQTIHYKVIKPEAQVVADLGNFLTTVQWYENPNDLFGRSPSVISYDYETKEHITQESRAWYAGLSDEAGAASWLAAMMKQALQPKAEEVAKLKRFVNETLWGGIQTSAEGRRQYGVRKSMFYYEPDSMPAGTYSDKINYKVWSAWPKKEAENLGRSYNYPHVAAAHWVMYRLARHHIGLEDASNWRLHLERAQKTAIAMGRLAPYYAQFGQMEGSIFLIILQDLQREGLTDLANELEAAMKKRADHWRTLGYPFGSEMPWDSTGQEEVYVWSRYFKYNDKAEVTLNAILAYMPTVPHWGYNGSARRYWDFVYGGKLSRIERQLHHYGSALNSIPVLTEFRDQPDDFYLLRVGHAGAMGALANVTEDGFGPAAFHSYPSTLANDGISGDYGSGFYGYAVNSGTYITQHPEFGWVAFSGNLTQKGAVITTKVTTSSKGRVFIAPAKLWLTTDAGSIDEVTYNTKTGEVTLTFDAKTAHTPKAFLFVEDGNKVYKVSGNLNKNTRGAYEIALGEGKTTVTLTK